MALANGVLKVRRDLEAGCADLNIEFDGDTSYPTGGTADFQDFVRDIVEAAAAAASDSNVRGAQSLEIVDIVPGDCGQYVPSYDKTNDKLFVRDGGSATWAEVANTTPLNGTKFNVTVLCR